MPRWGHSQNVGLKPFILGMPPPCGFILYINTSCGKFETKKIQQIQQIQSIYIFYIQHIQPSKFVNILQCGQATFVKVLIYIHCTSKKKLRDMTKLCDLHMFRITITFALCFILG